MAQLFRICKSEICCITRYYGTQRYQQNYYEILNVSSDASQKKIKQAFIRLSKQLHPDICGKHSHVDFVKLNEAYSVLGKESTRREYDLRLKYDRYNPSYTYTTQNNRYRTRWEYEVRTAGGPWPPPNAKPKSNFGLVIALLIFALGLTHMIFLIHSLNVRKLTLVRNEQLEREYQQIRDATQIKCSQSTIQDLNSEEDFYKYLATRTDEQ